MDCPRIRHHRLIYCGSFRRAACYKYRPFLSLAMHKRVWNRPARRKSHYQGKLARIHNSRKHPRCGLANPN